MTDDRRDIDLKSVVQQGAVQAGMPFYEESDRLMRLVVKTADDKKAHNIVVLNLAGISSIADYFVICHGNSDLQVQAIVTEIRKVCEEAGTRVRGVEGLDTGRWVLVDLGDVVVHVFHRDEREFYNLERLWADAPVVQL